MEVKIKTLYKDRVKPTDLLTIDASTLEEVRDELLGVISKAVEEIIDDNDNMVGIFISRE